MTYKLFIDDERFPVHEDWIIVRSSAEAIEYVQEHGCPNQISFDHDLGLDDTSMKFINWLIDKDLEGTFIPADFKFWVHSQNPVGANNIRAKLINYLNQR